MPLLEIVVGDKTSDESIARAIDVAQQIKKTPIVVNDSRGFYTSRVFGTYTREGMEWIDAATMKSVILRHFPELELTGLGNINEAANGLKNSRGSLAMSSETTSSASSSLAKPSSLLPALTVSPMAVSVMALP